MNRHFGKQIYLAMKFFSKKELTRLWPQPHAHSYITKRGGLKAENIGAQNQRRLPSSLAAACRG